MCPGIEAATPWNLSRLGGAPAGGEWKKAPGVAKKRAKFNNILRRPAWIQT